MTKRDLIKIVSDKTGFTQDNSELAVTAAIDAIAEAMAHFEKVSLRGIGTFTPVIRAPKQCFLPTSDKPIDVPAKNAFRFRLSDSIKQRINTED